MKEKKGKVIGGMEEERGTAKEKEKKTVLNVNDSLPRRCTFFVPPAPPLAIRSTCKTLERLDKSPPCDATPP